MPAHPDDLVYLRPDTKIQPLICRWYAWPHLTAPLPLAMNLAFRQIPALRSFVENPALHEEALRDSAMLGGPFVDLPPSSAARIQALLSESEQRAGRLLDLAQDFKAFDLHVQARARGGPVEPMLAQAPPSLQGLCEIVYDLNDHPRVLLLEDLISITDFGIEGCQEIQLTNRPDTARPFFMSTPVLDEPGDVSLPVPFADSLVDTLSRARTAGIRASEIEAHGLDLVRDGLVDFFTTEPPLRLSPDYSEDGVRIRCFGHACVLLQSADTSVLVDPLFAWDRTAPDQLTFADLPDWIDVVLISHAHQDHFCPEVLLQLRQRVGTVVVPQNNRGTLCDPSLRLTLNRLGFSNVITAQEFSPLVLGGARITPLPFPGEHADLDIQSRATYLVEMGGRTAFFAVDSNAAAPQLYSRLGPMIGNLDLLFIGMECDGAPLSWLYGPLRTQPLTRRHDRLRTLSGSNAARTWSITEALRPARVVIYGMGQEPWLKFMMGLSYTPESVQIQELDAFLRTCAQHQVQAQRLEGTPEFSL